MRLTLQVVADFIRDRRIPRALLSLFRRFRVFGYKLERDNRVARFNKIIKEYQGPASVESIAAKYQCNRSTVLRYARMAGLPPRPRTDDPERHAKILSFGAKIPQEEIAKQCECSVSLVSQVEGAAGLVRYRKGGGTPYRKK